LHPFSLMDLKFVILPVYMYYNKITTLYFCNIYQIWDHKPKDSSTLPLFIEVSVPGSERSCVSGINFTSKIFLLDLGTPDNVVFVFLFYSNLFIYYQILKSMAKEKKFFLITSWTYTKVPLNN
jgi:hypothetical protein